MSRADPLSAAIDLTVRIAPETVIVWAVAAAGIVATLYICSRLIRAVRAGGSRDELVGWLALLFLPALAVFAVSVLVGS